MTHFSLTSTEVTALSILIVWEIFWKGLALWKAARRNDKVWYVILLIINSVGILEIVYIFVFSKREDKVNKSAD